MTDAQNTIPPPSGTPPVHRLPPEILTDIFMNVDCSTDANSDVVSQSRFGKKRSDRPFRSAGSHLGSVCVYWRHVTLSSPSIWASLHIEIGHDGFPEQIVERLMLHIERSRSVPLSIILELAYFDEDQLRSIIQALTAPPHTAPSLDKSLFIPYGLLNLVLGQASRIRHLALCLGSAGSDAKHFADPLFSHFQNQFHILKHITVDWRYDDPQSILDLFAPSSRIVSFGLSDTILRSSQQYAFPYSRMTNMHIRYTERGLWTILPLCPNLRTADIVLCPGWADEAPPPPTMELSLQHLESLRIEVTHPQGIIDLPAIFNALNLPVLSSLSIGVPQISRRQTGMPQFITSFLGLITRLQSRSTSTIERLQLRWIPLQCDEFIALMENLPELLDLSILESYWAKTDPQNGRNQMLTCHVLEELGSGRILPKLKSLRMMLNNDWVGSDAFERMIESRPRLDSVYLKIIAETVPNLDVPRLRQLQHDRPGQAFRIVQEDIYGGQVELLGYSKDPRSTENSILSNFG